MSDPLQVPAGETRVVRVFHLDLPREHIRFLREEPAALADILGLAELDTAQADLLRLADLGPVGLSGYLSEGIGVPESAIAPEAAALDALRGHALVLRSGAFPPSGAAIAPKPGVRLAARLGEAATDWTGGRIDTASARPGARPARRSPRGVRSRARAIGGGIFTVVMLALALLLWSLLT